MGKQIEELMKHKTVRESSPEITHRHLRSSLKNTPSDIYMNTCSELQEKNPKQERFLF